MKSVLVIGAGHDGLAAAAWLAKRGHRVTVLERREIAGGQAALEEFAPGYRVPGISHHTFGLRPRVIEALGLEAHGLKRRETAPWLLAATPEGPGIALRTADDDLPDGLYRRTPDDVRAWTKWRELVRKLTPLAEELANRRPPVLQPGGFGDLFDAARPALAFRRLGPDTMIDALRNGPMCVADHVQDRFTDRLLCALLSTRGIEGGFLGPRSAGSAALLLLRECLYGPGVEGGPAALTEALLAACQANGVAIELEAEVAEVRVEGGRVVGALTADGRTFDARHVISTAGAATTLDRLLAPGAVGLKVRETARAVRRRGSLAAVRFALSSPLRFRGREEEAIPFARVAPDAAMIERAFDNVKHREFCSEPWLDVAVPSALRADLAPEGHASVSVLVPCAAHDLEGGWSDERCRDLARTVVDTLSPLTVDLEGSIVATEALSPTDLAARYALDGGHPFGAELDLNQLWALRPSLRFGRYATPIDGLYLGGRATHPGAEFLGSSGLAAAEAVLADA